MPKFYGLPKIHKLGLLTIRPIISNCGLYSDAVMLKMKSILNLLLWGTTSIANSYQLVGYLKNAKFEEDDVLLSFDVSSLFTRVPAQDTIQIVEERLTELRNLPHDPLSEITSLKNPAILKLLKLVLNQCFFTWDLVLYKQKSGLPMGSRLSPILANPYMEHIEHQVLCTTINVPKIYFRYVDDIFLLWNRRRGDYQKFLALLNAQHSDIELQIEPFYVLIKCLQ